MRVLELTPKRGRVVRYQTTLDASLSCVLDSDPSPITEIAVHPSGRFFATAHRSGTVKVWAMPNRELQASFTHHHPVRALAFAPDGTWLLAAGYGGEVRLWKVSEQNSFASLSWTDHIVQSVAVHPEGTFFALGGGRWNKQERCYSLGEVAFCQVEDFGAVVRYTWVAHEEPVHTVAFTPDGQQLLTGGWDGTVKVWRLERTGWGDWSGSLERTLTIFRPGWLRSFALSPKGTLLAAAGFAYQPLGSWWEVTTPLWHLAEGRPMGTLKAGFFRGHRKPVNAVAFSPTLPLIATGSDDKTVKVWDIRGKLLMSLEGHLGLVTAIAFSPDGKWLLSGDSSGALFLWQLMW